MELIVCFSTAVRGEHLTRLDDDILCIDEDTFEALQELEQGIWWPEYNRYYVGVEDRVRDLFDEAGMPYATISQVLRSAIRQAAERAAHRAVLVNDGYTPHDVEFVNGNPVVVRHFADLPTEFHDVDHLVEAEIEKYTAEGDGNEEEQKEGDEEEC